MRKMFQYVKQHPLFILLAAFPLALIAGYTGWDAKWVFAFSTVGIVPMAGYIGEATEKLAERTGPKIGGLLNATLGNAAELIITLVAINAGLLELVKASITGSILGNLLLVLGAAMVVGGAKNGIQIFDKRQSSNSAILMSIAVMALVIPSIFSHSIGEEGSPNVEYLSLGVAGVMIVLYVLGLIYSLKSAPKPALKPAHQNKNESTVAHTWTLTKTLLVLFLATVGVVWLSELLVGAVEHVVSQSGLSEFFLGIILIPIIGNAAEHLVAVQMAYRNQMDLGVEVAVSSSLQIALFVAPLLVFVSLALGHPLLLIFNPFELVAVGAGVLITTLVSVDGESSWIEGASLLAVYIILGISFFMLPA